MSKRVCVFCRDNSKVLTLEHLHPNWLSQYFKKGQVAINEVAGDGISRSWSKAIFQDKAKIVCGDCNNRWMSDIENTTKSLLEKLIFTTDGMKIDATAQAKIALWAQKTTLVMNKATGGKFQIPDDFYRDLYSSQTKPTKIMVSIGWRLLASGSKEKSEPLATFEIKQIARVQAKKHEADIFRQQVSDGKLAWAATLGLGRVVFQLFAHNMQGTLEVGGGDQRVLKQINPYIHDIDWPFEWPIEAVGGLDAVKKAV